MSSRLQNGFQYDQWTVEPLRGMVRHLNGEPRHLEPKVMDVFVCLAENSPNVVPRDELLTSIWNGQAASDELLTRAVSELRRVLEDDPRQSKNIETVPKRGYRLIGTVASAAVRVEREHVTSPSRIRPMLLGIAALIAIIAIFAWTTNTSQDSQSNPTATVSTVPQVRSIAVLPFRNRSAREEDQYFVDGIHEDIVTQLSKLSLFDKVISRTSTERYRDTVKPMPEIGDELGVTIVLEGGVQRAGDRIRINVQLIDAGSDQHLWAETYDRQLSTHNVFSIQSEIAIAVADALKGSLTQSEASNLSAFPTADMDAYEAYLLGKHALAKRTVGDLEIARQYFSAAIDADAGFALAHVGLADSTGLLVLYGGLPESEYRNAETAAREALRLRPDLGEALASLGFIQWRYFKFHRSKFAISDETFRSAQELAPYYPPAYQWHAFLLLEAGRKTEAAAMMQRAILLDPFDPVLHADLGAIYSQTGQEAAALNSYRRALEIAPDFPLVLADLGGFELIRGRPANAVYWFRKALDGDPENVRATARMISAYLALGDQQSAELWYQRLSERPESFWQRVYGIIIELSRGNDQLAYEKASSWLETNGECVFCLEVMAHHLVSVGRPAGVVDLYRIHRPALLDSPDISVRQSNLYLVAPLAQAMMDLQRSEEAADLLEAALGASRTIPRMISGERGTGIEDVRFYAILGQTIAALDALQVAVDDGWRVRHERLDLALLENLEDQPRFAAAKAEMEDDIRKQRESLDDPLSNVSAPAL